MPGIKWSSSSDQTDFLPGLHCSRLETPLSGSAYKDFTTFWKILRLIEGIP